MSQLAVPIDTSVPLRRPVGKQVTVFNQSATDVYFDADSKRINASVPGAVPAGSKIAAGQGFNWDAYPEPGVMWFRAAAACIIDVQP